MPVHQGRLVCVTGVIGNQWTIDSFALMTDIPHTVRLTAYSSGPQDSSAKALQRLLVDLDADPRKINVDRVFRFEQIVEAHRYMEQDRHHREAGGTGS